jgi:TonB family protein
MSSPGLAQPDARTGTATAVVCQHCGAEVRRGRKFCSQCGTPIRGADNGPATGAALETWRCPGCGVKNQASKELCRSCGAPLAPANQPSSGSSRSAVGFPEVKLEGSASNKPLTAEAGGHGGVPAEPPGRPEDAREPCEDAAWSDLREATLSESPPLEMEPSKAPNRAVIGLLVLAAVAVTGANLFLLRRSARGAAKPMGGAPFPASVSSAETVIAPPSAPAPPSKPAVRREAVHEHPGLSSGMARVREAIPATRTPSPLNDTVGKSYQSAPSPPVVTPASDAAPEVNSPLSRADAKAQAEAAPEEFAEQQSRAPSPTATTLTETPSPSVAAPAKPASAAAPVSVAPERLRVGGSVQAAKLLNHPAPVYPSIAREARIQGLVRLEVVIGKDGKVHQTRVMSGDTLLARAAVDAVRNWSYQPTELDGQPVDVSTEVDLQFKLPE